MTNNRRLVFFEKLAALMRIAPENQVFDTLNKAIDQQLEVHGPPKQREIVSKILELVLKEYELPLNALQGCYSHKKRHLSDPKKMWVIVAYTIIPDLDRIQKLIGNGLGRAHIYRYQNEFLEMTDNVPHHKEFKQKFNKIIESYGEDTVL
jgi:hypothetical protein